MRCSIMYIYIYIYIYILIIIITLNYCDQWVRAIGGYTGTMGLGVM